MGFLGDAQSAFRAFSTRIGITRFEAVSALFRVAIRSRLNSGSSGLDRYEGGTGRRPSQTVAKISPGVVICDRYPPLKSLPRSFL